MKEFKENIRKVQEWSSIHVKIYHVIIVLQNIRGIIVLQNIRNFEKVFGRVNEVLKE